MPTETVLRHVPDVSEAGDERTMLRAPAIERTWDPWFPWFGGIWFTILAVHGLRAYFGPAVRPLWRYIRRPVPEADAEREIVQLQSHRSLVA
jgi:hypothetical protein